jgi:hypothetical protein
MPGSLASIRTFRSVANGASASFRRERVEGAVCVCPLCRRPGARIRQVIATESVLISFQPSHLAAGLGHL